ncbi:hypothetical protein [Paenibacillus terrae]|uniref:hypothetical protein n=1 Tax=Paenibacillus terrae TaxID=159743 RepID=UPI0011EB19F8|nr:hypothetical protein [Paenibacillus terrae]
MASEKTPNLGLNQIDRTSPKTTYFDLEKYLDQNWRAVDDFAGDVNDGVNAIKKRLDTTERKEVTLEPGVQIVHAEKAAPFSLTGLSGRTLVNLLGRWGNMESIANVGIYKAILTKDTTNKTQGASSLKVTIDSGQLGAAGFYSNFSWKAGKYYVAIADVKNGTAERAYLASPGYVQGNYITDTHGFSTSWFRFAPSVDGVNNIDLAVMGTESQYAYFDAVRIYEISAADYTALANMTAEQVATKYPYVDSVTPVRNPYAIRYGENLLPTLYEWSAKQGSPVILDLQSVLVTSDNKLIHNVSPVVPGKTYTLSVESSDANGRISVTNNPESTVLADKTGSGLLSVTFTVPIRETSINVRLLGTATTPVTISNPMLNIGNTAKPFKPREDSMLALQTDLYADPITGENADTVLERDGQYFKAKKWKSVTLDGSFAWTLPGSYPGYKVAGISGLPPAKAYDSLYVAKYDGKILTHNSAMTAADNAYFRNQTTKDAFDVSISSPDSGWGDSYTPSADEIKAYFNGWKMKISGQVASSTYNGIGEKAWVEQVYARKTPAYIGEVKAIDRISTEGPLAYTLNGETPYQLVYQLATTTVEPILSEGQLTFTEGDNQVEVGTGIVLRERASVYTETASDYGWRMNINNASFGAPLLKNRTVRLLAVYKDGLSDQRWRKSSSWTTSAGALAQMIYATSKDLESSYSITYFTVDTSPAASFVGSYAANEKTLLLDLVDSVQQNTARVSVLENKKAEKDSPAWITPTLLNGWTAVVGLQAYTAGYYKDSSGVIHMRGWLTGGATAQATSIFRLPIGYRPIQRSLFVCYDSSTAGTNLKTSAVVVNLDGTVAVDAVSGANLSLYQVSFLAEQ